MYKKKLSKKYEICKIPQSGGCEQPRRAAVVVHVCHCWCRVGHLVYNDDDHVDDDDDDDFDDDDTL